MYTPEPGEKFDFQNLDTKLYLALRNIMENYEGLLEDAGCKDAASEPSVVAAKRAMYEFQQSCGPIPEWAKDRNWGYEMLPGAQLCTKDGRRTGNAHIIKVKTLKSPEFVCEENPYGEYPAYECLTDAGQSFVFNGAEILEAFTVGEWISDVERVVRDFDRHGLFK
jgi:hypothetical protein